MDSVASVATGMASCSGKTGREEGSSRNRSFLGRVFTYAAFVLLLCSEASGIDKKQVQSPPKFILQSPVEVTFKEKERVEIPCKASGDPMPSYYWKKDDANLTIGIDARQIPGSGTLVIEEPLITDEGIYQCFAANKFGVAISIKTVLKKAVLEPFPTVKEPRVHRIPVGAPLTLNCNPPLSYPRGIVYWGENNQSSKLNSIENTERIALDYNGKLYFSNVEMEDARKGLSYVCIQQNSELRSLVQGDDQRVDPDGKEKPKLDAPKLMWSSPVVDVALKGQSKKKKVPTATLR